MSFSEFEQHVKTLVSVAEFNSYRHNLSAVTPPFYQRYLDTVTRGFNMAYAYSVLVKGQKLSDNHYRRYLNFVATATVVAL